MLISWIQNHKKTSIAVAVLLLLVSVVGFLMVNYKIAPLGSGIFGFINAEDNLAIEGYDPVAYHVLGEARQGNSMYAHQYLGVDWHFISAEHQQLFASSPETYAPRYGGFCAFATYLGITTQGDPQIWHIEAGQLYLFFMESPKTDFLAQVPAGIIEESDQNWATANLKDR